MLWYDGRAMQWLTAHAVNGINLSIIQMVQACATANHIFCETKRCGSGTGLSWVRWKQLLPGRGGGRGSEPQLLEPPLTLSPPPTTKLYQPSTLIYLHHHNYFQYQHNFRRHSLKQRQHQCHMELRKQPLCVCARPSKNWIIASPPVVTYNRGEQIVFWWPNILFTLL